MDDGDNPPKPTTSRGFVEGGRRNILWCSCPPVGVWSSISEAALFLTIVSSSGEMETMVMSGVVNA